MVYSSKKRKASVEALNPNSNPPYLKINNSKEKVKYESNDSKEEVKYESNDSKEEESHHHPPPPPEKQTVFMVNHETNYHAINPKTGETDDYYYLSDTILEQQFSSIHVEVSEKEIGLSTTYQIHLALFQLITEETPTPFLLFSLQPSKEPDGSLTFPSKEYTPTLSASSSPDKDPLDTEFMNLCLSSIADLYPHFPEVQTKDLYKGFVQENKDIYVFFDISPVFQKPDEEEEEEEEEEEPLQEGGAEGSEGAETKETGEKEETPIWATLEEIILYKSFQRTTIQSHLADFFLQRPYTYTIQNKYGLAVPTPHRLFCCKSKENVLSTVKIEDFSEDSLNMVDTIEHPQFGQIYLFTNQPIGGSNPQHLRFVGFVEDALYLMKPIDEISTPLPKQVETAGTIYYQENGKSYWAFRSDESFVPLR
jgi:hypothetical protein